MNETQEQDSKQVMSKKDASYHTTRASIAGRRQAAAQGADPQHVDALMITDADGVMVGDMMLKPLTLATVWALQKLGSSYNKDAASDEPKEVDPADVALAALCFADPVRVFNLAKQGKRDVLEEEAFNLALHMDFETMGRVNEYINAQLSSVSEPPAAEPGKKQDQEKEEKESAS